MQRTTRVAGQSIRDFIGRVVLESPLNRLTYLDGSPVSDEPLVGFADAHDPLIAQFKNAIGPSHLNPLEAWQTAFPNASKPENLSVIAWVLPLSEAIRKSNRGPDLPSQH